MVSLCITEDHRSHTLWLFNIAMEAMVHRNRWFTVLKNGWIFPSRTVSHNQMVFPNLFFPNN